MSVKSITLQSKINGSFKEYAIQIVEKGDGFVVNYQNGRIGGTMAGGTKTVTPVTLDAANKIFEKLMKEKMTGSSQYRPVDEVSAGFSASVNVGVSSGIQPQLLNYADEADVEAMINSDDWVAQEKFDGENRIAKIDDGQFDGVNRKGLIVSLPNETVEDLKALSHKIRQGVLCSEIIGNDLHVFDLLESNGVDMRDIPYNLRLKALNALLNDADGHVKLVETAFSTNEKRLLFNRVKEEGGEGVVFKRKSAAYAPGKDHADQVKFKFYDECSVIVEAINSGVRSVKVAVLDNSQKTEVGSVTIPSNHEVPTLGSVVEVKYLYAYKGGSLYQPQYRGERTDIDPSECTIDQLKYKQERKLTP